MNAVVFCDLCMFCDKTAQAAVCFKNADNWFCGKQTAQGYRGDFVTGLVDCTNVFFGDVNTPNVQEQPYILIAGRELVTRLRDEARSSGASMETFRNSSRSPRLMARTRWAAMLRTGSRKS